MVEMMVLRTAEKWVLTMVVSKVHLMADKWAVAKAGLLVGMWVGPKGGLKAAQ